jgi:predicted transcriptional regulator
MAATAANLLDDMTTQAKRPVQLTVRIDEETVEKLDALAEKLTRPGLPVSRIDALRVAVATGLEAIANERKK